MNSRPKFRPLPSWKPKARSRFVFKRKENNLCTNLAAKGRPIRASIKGKIASTAAVGKTAGHRKSIARIGKHWEHKPPVVRRGEREICNPATDEGRAEYKWRTLLMWLRQN